MSTPAIKAPDPAFIRAYRLRKYYQLGDQWVRALDSVDIQIPERQFIAIMGPSGSGKTTLLQILGGLDQPSDGSVTVAGRMLDRASDEVLAAFRREMVGFIFQSFNLVPSMTALENVALPGVFLGMPRPDREARAARLLRILEMGDRLDHRPKQLSGGQQQRVAIARALFNNPRIIMGDEPTGQLDSKTGRTVMEMLKTLAQRHSKTVIVVTHDETVARYADRIVRLKDGVIVSDEMLAPLSPPTQEEMTDAQPTPIRP
jgi:ABC-type lipoprotein export system ATPase subunit